MTPQQGDLPDSQSVNPYSSDSGPDGAASRSVVRTKPFRTLIYVRLHVHPRFEPIVSSNVSIIWGARHHRPQVVRAAFLEQITGEIPVMRDPLRSRVEMPIKGTVPEGYRVVRLTRDEARRAAALILFQAERLERVCARRVAGFSEVVSKSA